MLVPNRHASSNSYRYGFQGQEKDDELKGEGNSVNYEARMQDTRVGRFLSIDPLAKQFPSLTPYQFASNDPIESIDLDGKERYDYRWGKDNKGKPTLILVSKTDIVDRVIVGYRSGHSFYNDAPVPVYENRINQRQEFIVHNDHEVYLDNNGGLNMDKPQRKEIFDVKTFYKTKSDMLKGINGSESLADRFKIAMAINANAMGPENAALPAGGLGNIRFSKVGGLTNLEARVWYLEQEAKIPSLINKTVSLEAQAKQAVKLRNAFRTEARLFMEDRNLALKLAKEEPNMTWEQVVKKYSDGGKVSGDALYKKIIESSQKSRPSVNKSLGLDKK